MSNENFTNHPSLKPTVLARDVLKNVYRPSGPREVPRPSVDATVADARETNRAA